MDTDTLLQGEALEMLKIAPADTFLQGDALTVLKTLPDGIVQTCVSSPPYYGLRDYGKEGQIGMEETPDAYVSRLVEVFREVRRVLRDDGTLWLNLGDSFSSGNSGQRQSSLYNAGLKTKTANPGREPQAGMLPKQLLGIPWRVAFALQADGWYLRSDIIWAKSNPMPESIRDRPTKSHEYLFLLAKSERYFYDSEAIKEPCVDDEETFYKKRDKIDQKFIQAAGRDGLARTRAGFTRAAFHPTRNKRSVWTIATRPYKGAHFAVMPPDLVLPCILAGSSPQACESCGAPWRRTRGIVSSWRDGAIDKAQQYVNNPGILRPGGTRSDRYRATSGGLSTSVYQETGWEPSCKCPINTGSGKSLVLDPFSGAGTVALVAQQQGRSYLGIELNPEYIHLAQDRLAKQSRPLLLAS